MNGDPNEETEAVFEDPLGLIPPPSPVASDSPPVSFCDECGGIDFHLDHCPLMHGPKWVLREEKREKLRAVADASIPQLAVIAARRVGARLLRRIARVLDA